MCGIAGLVDVAAGLVRGGPFADRFLEPAFLFQAGERELHRFRRRGLEPAAAAPMEIDRRFEKLEQHPGRLHGRRLPADIVLCQRAEIELR